MSSEVLSVQNISFAYQKDVPILKDISFSLQEGERIGLVGANGVGKSTLLKLLVGLEFPTKGSILVCDHEVNKKNLSTIRKQLGYIFQDSNHQLFSSTVFDDVAFGPTNYGLSQEEVEEKVSHALSLVHLEQLKNRSTYTLSGGEKKLAAIATVLAMEPTILLMDEPSIALDPRNRRNLIHVLNDLPMAKIIASHDLDFILDTCDRCILLSKEGIVANDSCKNILTNKQLLEENGLELPLSLYNHSYN